VQTTRCPVCGAVRAFCPTAIPRRRARWRPRPDVAGKGVASWHRRHTRISPFPRGTAAAAETVSPEVDLECRREALLAGYQGFFHLGLAGPYLLDVNPRVHATLPVGISAGVNLVALYCDLYCDLLRGRSVEPVRAPPGHFYRWIEGDVRSVLESVRNGRMSVLSASARSLRVKALRRAAHRRRIGGTSLR
jgi:hypothetical protein